MSDLPAIRALLGLCVALGSAGSLAGQSLEDLRARLRLAVGMRDSILERSREPQVAQAGGIYVVLPGGSPPGLANAVAAGVAGAVREAGWFDTAVLRRIVLVDSRARLQVEVVREIREERRLPVLFEYEAHPSSPESTARYAAGAAADRLAAAAVQADSGWSAWLDRYLQLTWDRRTDNARVANELLLSAWTSGRACLAERVSDCESFLGLNEGPRALLDRYQAPDIRRALEVDQSFFERYQPQVGALGQACLAGDEEACRAFLEHIGWRVAPASADARRSVVELVRERHGTAAVRALLRDTSGTIASRFSRASGETARDLVSAWRAWIFEGARWAPVRAGVREAFPALLVAGGLLLLAARSGRWRG